MLTKISHTILLFLPSIFAGDGCSQSQNPSNCVCYSDSIYYTSEECYSDNSPWGGTDQRPQQNLPDSPSKQNIIFQCYSMQNRNSFESLQLNQTLPTNFSLSKETILLIHGFQAIVDDDSWMIRMKDEFYNNNFDYNICIVDWTKGANVETFHHPDYPKASQNTRVVGDVTGQLIDWLSNYTQQSYENDKFTCIGHSLGAHVCGYAGKIVKNGPLKRISGLDPAGPYFEYTPDYVRLDKNDAKFVDSIHTDGDFLGLLQEISDTDFYPNSGYHQPGCRNKSSCSHDRSHELYIDSIGNRQCFAYPCKNEEDFSAGRCNSCGTSGCQLMGWPAYENQNNGSFYLETTSESFWCLL